LSVALRQTGPIPLDVAFDCDAGDVLALFGPSGSGKTTILRAIAGLYVPAEASIRSAGEIWTDTAAGTFTAPHRRAVGFVFQDYALFPHLTVGENVAYGLKVKRVKRAERNSRAAEALALVRLGGLEGRKPSQLSGGQRQRVALARAIVNRPQVLLLDEPLGALDLKLRQEMQIELKRIQQEVGITFVYVTHDQEEALTMSDRLAVFNNGRIEQVGGPAEVYEHPETEFVAGFVGVSNVLERALNGQPGRFTVRPEKIRILEENDTAEAGAHSETGRIRDVVYVGMVTRYAVELDEGGVLMVIRQNLETTSGEALEARGRRVRLAWRPEHTYAIETGKEEEQHE
jgi:putative spermidine/putrescine transport system ATP-binding protein